MALTKNLQTNFGIDATYWNIHSADINWTNKTVKYSLYGYQNSETRQNNLAPLATRVFENTLSDLNYSDGDNIREKIYEYLQSKESTENDLNEFFEAEDC